MGSTTERNRRFRARRHAEKHGPDAGDLRGKHGNHARGSQHPNWRGGQTATLVREKEKRLAKRPRDTPRAKAVAVPPRVRFNRLVDRSAGPDACWPWTGALNKKGYGRFGNTTAQRACVLFDREIPIGHTVDHLCRNRACVNPLHLEPVPHRVNLMRGDTTTSRYASRLACGNGHEWTTANTHLSRKGRRCRACANALNKKHYVKRGKHRNGHAWLTSEQRTGIYDAVALGQTHGTVAKQFGVSQGSVSRVVARVRAERAS